MAISTVNLDSGSDNPALARVELLAAVTAINKITDQLTETPMASIGNSAQNQNSATGDSPHIFEVTNDNTSNQSVRLNAYGAATNGNNMHWCRYFGTVASPSAVQSGAYFQSMGYRGWDGSGALSQSYAAYQVVATENWTPSSHGIRFQWEVAKTSGSTRYSAMKLYSGSTDGAILELGDASTLLARILNAGNSSGTQIHGSNNQAGAQAVWFGSGHATSPSESLHRSTRLIHQTVAGSEIYRVTSTGVAIGKGGDAGYALEVKGLGANVFNLTASGGTAMVYATNGGGTFATGESSTAAALYFRKDGTSNRSINAAGTINASGADYAEYMVRASDCGAIAKGQIVGIDINGHLTTRWDDSVSFAIKSTDPSIVGGDTWFTEPRPGDEALWPDFDARMEAARETVERIAFCGRVPCNVAGAMPGDYIVPVREGDGIVGTPIAEPTLSQYLMSVGRCISIDPDGRPSVIVKSV